MTTHICHSFIFKNKIYQNLKIKKLYKWNEIFREQISVRSHWALAMLLALALAMPK